MTDATEIRKLINLTESLNEYSLINPNDLDFDMKYIKGEHYIYDKATRMIIDSAGSGGLAMQKLDNWNSPAGKKRAASILNDRREEEEYARQANTDHLQ